MLDGTDKGNNCGLKVIILVGRMVFNTSVVMVVVVVVMAAMEGHLNNCGWCPIQGSRSKPNFEFSPPLL